MMVQTGPMRETSWPSDSRRFSPRSTASATARHCGSVNDTVALMLMPSAVAASIAGMPALVAGILTIMFGARPSKRRACSTIASAIAVEPRVGLDRQPPVAALMRRERRQQQRGGVGRQPFHRRPPDLILGGRGHVADERRNSRPPLRHPRLQHGVRDHRIARRADAAVLDRLPQLVGVGRVVPQTRRRGLRHLVQRALPGRSGSHRAHHTRRSRTGHRDTETQRIFFEILLENSCLSKCSYRPVLQLQLHLTFESDSLDLCLC